MHTRLEDMGKADRIRACYQHCCLKYVMNEKMTNQSLRERFKLAEDRGATVSQIIAGTVEKQMIKAADPSQASTRYRSYLPFWA
jgi:ATP-dependent DNA helicase RecG